MPIKLNIIAKINISESVVKKICQYADMLFATEYKK